MDAEHVLVGRDLEAVPLVERDVDRNLQGQGIGTQVLQWYSRQADEAGLVAYLETDKAINVTLYQRHGFEVTADEDVLGVHCWYMRRPPRS